jgi:hypothetical protein
MQNIREGRTRVVIGSPCSQAGLDMPVMDIAVIPEPMDSVESLTQSFGRIGRGNSGGHGIAYAPDWMREEDVFDLDGDPTRRPAKKPMTQKTLAARKNRRDTQPDAMVAFFNPPSPELCCRDVLCDYFGDENRKPLSCCNGAKCQPDDSHNKEVEDFVQRALEAKEKAEKPRLPPLPAGSQPRVPDEEMKLEIATKVQEWRLREWKDNTGPLKHLRPRNFMPDHIVKDLTDKFHLLTTKERVRIGLHGWKHLDQHSDSVWELVQSVNPAHEKI